MLVYLICLLTHYFNIIGFGELLKAGAHRFGIITVQPSGEYPLLAFAFIFQGNHAAGQDNLLNL